MKIVLVGYMGSGKTTLGRLLANQLTIRFIDLDTYIEEREGISIKDIFETKGELYFRKKEITYVREVLTLTDDFVLSTGGGTPCFGDNMQYIVNHVPNTFYVHVSLQELVTRLATQRASRPLISGVEAGELPEFIGKHLFERSYFYHMAPNIVYTEGKSPEECVQEIIKGLI